MSATRLGSTDVKVSVAMITYNHDAYIAQAVESVLMQQTDFTFELVIGEDCSTDDTRAIVQEYAQRYPEYIRLLLPEQNLGMRVNFITTWQACRGQYIALLEGDDYWTDLRKLQKQVTFLDGHPECTICFHNVMMRYEDGTRSPHPFSIPLGKEIFAIEDLWSSNFIPGCAAMMPRAALSQFPSWFSAVRWPDWALYLLYAEQGKIGYINEFMGVYRIHAGGAWSGLGSLEQYEAVIRFYHDMNRHLRYKYNDLIQSALATHYFQLANEYERAGQPSSARRYALHCLLAFRHHQNVNHRKLAKLMLRLFVPRFGATDVRS